MPVLGLTVSLLTQVIGNSDLPTISASAEDLMVVAGLINLHSSTLDPAAHHEISVPMPQIAMPK